MWSQLVTEASQGIRAAGGLGVPGLAVVRGCHALATSCKVCDSSGEEGDCGPGSCWVGKHQWQRAVQKAQIEGSVRKELNQLKESKAAKSGETEGKGKKKAFNLLPKPLVGSVAVQ